MNCYALHNGPDLELARAELAALLEVYGIESKPLGQGALSRFEADEVPLVIAKRASLTKEVGRLVGLYSDLKEALRDASYVGEQLDGTFKVESEGFEGELKMKVERMVGEELSKQGAEVNLFSPRSIVRICRLDDLTLVGITSMRLKRKWVDRRPRARPFFHPSALHPKLARLMVNLSRAKEGDVLLDPCAGTASILIEACMVGVEALGIELSKKMLYGCRRNMVHFCKGEWGLILADARSPPLNSVDTLVTDPPYGRGSSTLGLNAERLRSDVLHAASSLLRRGRYAVVMSPMGKEPESEEFEVVSRHHLYVHANLTRSISVYRKR